DRKRRSAGALMMGSMDSTSWSPQTMIERIGDDEELARQLVTLFLAECPRMMGDLRTSVEGGVADTVRRAAHAFKGSVSNFIDDGPVATAQQIETLARSEEHTSELQSH